MVGVKILIIGFGDKCNVQGVETVDTSFFITAENLEKLEKARETNSVEVRCLHFPHNLYLASEDSLIFVMPNCASMAELYVKDMQLIGVFFLNFFFKNLVLIIYL